MPSFTYKARTSIGETVTGKYDAGDKSMVVSLLRSKGYYPIEINEDHSSARSMDLSMLKRVGVKDLTVFCRQFATLINSGVSINNALDMLRKQTENLKLKQTVNHVFEDVQKGHTLSESMAKYPGIFPGIFINMVEVGEVSGTLDLTMNKLAVHFEKDNRIRSRIRSAMMYPAIIGVLATLMIIGMLTFVVPGFVVMFNDMGVKLPLLTQILVSASNFMVNWWYIIIVVVALLVYIVRRFFTTDKGKELLHRTMIRLPMAGKPFRKILASRFSRTLSALLSSGVQLIRALEVTDKVVDNAVLSKGMGRVKEDIKRGSALADPLESIDLFPVMMIHMIHVGEETGSLDSIMEKVADFYDEEVDAAIGQLIALLEPLLIVIMAVIVGGMVISIVLPMFEMYSAIGK